MKICLLGLLGLWLALPLVAWGQETDKVIITGIVVDADSLHPLPSVHVRAKNTNLGAVTELDGRFNMRVPANDSIVFSIVGYKSYLIVPADSTEAALSNLTIKMIPRVYELSGVKVKEYVDITKYIRRTYDRSIDMRKSKGTPLFEEKEPVKKNAVGFSNNYDLKPANLEGAVTAFANLFNDEFQQTKKLNKILAMEELEKKQQSSREVMTEKFQAMVLFVADLSYSELLQFTDYYMPDPSLMVEMTDYGLAEGILLDLEQFKPAAKKDKVTLEQQLKEASFKDRDHLEKIE